MNVAPLKSTMSPALYKLTDIWMNQLNEMNRKIQLTYDTEDQYALVPMLLLRCWRWVWLFWHSQWPPKTIVTCSCWLLRGEISSDDVHCRGGFLIPRVAHVVPIFSKRFSYTKNQPIVYESSMSTAVNSRFHYKLGVYWIHIMARCVLCAWIIKIEFVFFVDTYSPHFDREILPTFLPLVHFVESGLQFLIMPNKELSGVINTRSFIPTTISLSLDSFTILWPSRSTFNFSTLIMSSTISSMCRRTKRTRSTRSTCASLQQNDWPSPFYFWRSMRWLLAFCNPGKRLITVVSCSRAIRCTVEMRPHTPFPQWTVDLSSSRW